MEKQELLKMFENCIDWCNDGPEREIFGVVYQPTNNWHTPQVLIFERNVGVMAVKDLSPIDLPAGLRAAKIAELEKLKEELEG